jgi:hypothetical protein
MPSTIAEVQFLLVWIGAGFIANTVRDVVCPGAKITDFEKTIIAVIHSAVTVAILDLVLKAGFRSDAITWLVAFAGWKVIVLFGVAALQGMAYGTLLKSESFQTMLGYVGVKNRTSPTVWNEAMIIGRSGDSPWVEVVMQDGTRYRGYLHKVSVNQDGHERELLVKGVVRLPADGGDERELHAAYIDGNSVVAVEFI